MLKKSLIALAVLAITLPAVAGDTKVHTPWPTVYVPQAIVVIDVKMDVGFYIHIKDQKAIKVHQDSSAANPYQTYVGCKTTKVISNFDAVLSGKVVGTSLAKGSWKATFNGDKKHNFAQGSSNVEICVAASSLKIEELNGGNTNVVVAELTVMVVPQS